MSKHRLNSEYEQVKNWLSTCSDEDKLAYQSALFEIVSRQGQEVGVNTISLPGHINRQATRMATGHYVVWADLVDYPSYFNIMFVGRLYID